LQALIPSVCTFSVPFFSRLPPAPAPSPANPPGAEVIQSASASSSKPSKSNLAFDPLGARGSRKKSAASVAVEGTPEASAAVPSTDEYNEDELNDMSAGLSQLLAELARGKYFTLYFYFLSALSPSRSLEE